MDTTARRGFVALASFRRPRLMRSTDRSSASRRLLVSTKGVFEMEVLVDEIQYVYLRVLATHYRRTLHFTADPCATGGSTSSGSRCFFFLNRPVSLFATRMWRCRLGRRDPANPPLCPNVLLRQEKRVAGKTVLEFFGASEPTALRFGGSAAERDAVDAIGQSQQSRLAP